MTLKAHRGRCSRCGHDHGNYRAATQPAEAVRAAPEAAAWRWRFLSGNDRTWRHAAAVPGFDPSIIEAQPLYASTTPATTEAATQPVKAATPLTEWELHDALDAGFRQAALDGTWREGRRQSVIAAEAGIRAFAEKNGMTLAGGEG